jgi:transcriptional regulator of acetoin/glycerol metabolism
LIAEAVETVSLALRTRHPVWLAGGPGTGAYEVARALHGSADSASFVSVRRVLGNPAELDERIRAALEADPENEALTLYVERLDRQPLAVQERVLRVSDEGVAWRGRALPVRLLAQTDEECRPREVLGALHSRLSVLVLPLPPLSQRRSEIPTIALALVDQLSEELGLPGPVIDDGELRRLSEREWPRNLEDLKAVLTYAVLSAQRDRAHRLDAPSGRSVPVRARAAEPAGDRGPASSFDLREIEVVIAELAHELKNPMVTIKTFAENLDQLANDPTLREKFVALTREAIARMDGFLEEILRFSRFSEPRLRKLSVITALSRALETNEARVRDRVKTDGVPGNLVWRVDEEQLAFAFGSLLRGLCRETPSEAPVSVALGGPGELVFSAGVGGGTQPKLHGMLDHQTNGSRSLDFIMAEALIRRNGGSSEIVRRPDQLNVHVTFSNLEREADGR